MDSNAVITTTTATHCPYCALQCGMNVVHDGTGWGIEAGDFPTNRGGLCRKGWTAAALLNKSDRLLGPLLRDSKDAPLRPASWDEALDRIASRIRAIQAAAGPDAVAVFGGGGLTNEKAYALGKFARVALRTANIDYNGRFCMASAAAAGNLRAFGIDRGLPFPLADIPGAEAILLTGANPAETMPPIMQYFDAQPRPWRQADRLRPAPHRDGPCSPTCICRLHAWHRRGALANGLLHIAVARQADRRTTSSSPAHTPVGRPGAPRRASYWPDRVERITGVPAADIERAARHARGGIATAMVLVRARHRAAEPRRPTTWLGLHQPGCWPSARPGASRLRLWLPDRPGQRPGRARARPEGRPAAGLPQARRTLSTAPRWRRFGACIPKACRRPGLHRRASCSRTDAARVRDVRGLMVMALQPLVSAPDASDAAGAANRRWTCSWWPTCSSPRPLRRADVVLPITQWAEEDGTMTNLEGPCAAPPQGEGAATRREARTC